ncbi:MAG: hypothetical protein IJU69_00155 [Bacteroidales bacterium]|nr:hypothetical protein [Bacteroidales bacterium]
MKFTDLFSSFAELSKYAEGLTADTPYAELHPSIRTTGAEIVKLISQPVYDAIAGYAALEHPTDAQAAALELLRTAMAAGAQYRFAIFSAVKKNGSEASLYKYQHEEMKDHYQSAYWTAIDGLLDWLDENSDTGGYAGSAQYRERQALPVKSAAEFNRYYGIDSSSLFYSKVLFLIRQVWASRIAPVVGAHTDNEDIMEAARTALCYAVMAKAVMHFDITELPRSIRWDYNHEYTKASQMQERSRLAADLNSQAAAFLESIQNLIKASAGGDVRHNYNEEGNKFYSTI